MKVVFKKIERCCSIQLEDQCINALAHERSDLNINIAQVLNANAQVGARGAAVWRARLGGVGRVRKQGGQKDKARCDQARGRVVGREGWV